MTKTIQSAKNVLDVLAALSGHFEHGLTPTDLCKATGFSPSNITRYVATLEEKGFAERIPETGRIRPSAHLARHAVSILRSLDAAAERLENMKSRITSTN